MMVVLSTTGVRDTGANTSASATGREHPPTPSTSATIMICRRKLTRTSYPRFRPHEQRERGSVRPPVATLEAESVSGEDVLELHAAVMDAFECDVIGVK